MPVKQANITLPVVALRGIVIFPGMRIHFEVGRKKSIAAVMAAMNSDQQIFLVAQRSIIYENPTAEQLFNIGVKARIRQVIKTPGHDSIRVVVEGVQRASIVEVVQQEPYIQCTIKPRKDTGLKAETAEYCAALVRQTKDYFEQYSLDSSKLAADVALSVAACDEPGELADCIAANAFTDFRLKQDILGELNVIRRLENLCVMLARESDILELEEQIHHSVQEKIEKNQREYYLHEQLKAISEELNDGEDLIGEVEHYKEQIYALPIDEQSKDKLIKECNKLVKMQSSSPEANVIRGYLDTCLLIPWGVLTEDNLDLSNVKKVLDDDHYGLEKVKQRFVETMAVRTLSPEIKGQIICLVGPPGVDKTSVAKSVAAALGRKYARVSLGGIRDEAEIRGHRRTYIGAMPGRIITALQNAGSMNPLILLDEIDKLGFDYKGDPSAALLEALDSEQNSSFSDHFIGLPVDLSKVLFITTANDKSTIPQPLLDRMEVIELSSYTQEEKLQIAKRHLVKQELQRHGLNGRMLRITDGALSLLIEAYTREAGVRRLKQCIGEICRKAAVRIVSQEAKCVSVKESNLEEFMGPRKFKEESSVLENKVGVVNGLAWTSVGGELLQVEALVLDGTGKVELTGSLGDVMKESAHAALSYIRSIASSYGIPTDFYKTKDIHIHVPQGAVPKDGPSAGVTIATALLSALTDKETDGSVAMTGEISLTGRVMAIGGLKEKTMAAYKAGIKTVIIPFDNLSDLHEVEDVVKTSLTFVAASKLDDVFSTALADNTVVEKKQTVSVTEKPTAQKRTRITQ